MTEWAAHPEAYGAPNERNDHLTYFTDDRNDAIRTAGLMTSESDSIRAVYRSSDDGVTWRKDQKATDEACEVAAVIFSRL